MAYAGDKKQALREVDSGAFRNGLDSLLAIAGSRKAKSENFLPEIHAAAASGIYDSIMGYFLVLPEGDFCHCDRPACEDGSAGPGPSPCPIKRRSKPNTRQPDRTKEHSGRSSASAIRPEANRRTRKASQHEQTDGEDRLGDV